MNRRSNSNSNRRRNRRQPPKRTSKIACYKGSLGLGKNLAISFKDLSEAGTCLLVCEPLAQKQEVEVHFESLNHRRPFRVLGKVTWMKPADDGNYWIGVHFEKPIPWQDLQVLSKFS